MARQRRASPQGDGAQDQGAAPQGDGVERFVLARNHGLVVGGVCRHYEAGTEFDPETDGALISQLIRAGAQFE
jgi:hypothetical protein